MVWPESLWPELAWPELVWPELFWPELFWPVDKLSTIDCDGQGAGLTATDRPAESDGVAEEFGRLTAPVCGLCEPAPPRLDARGCPLAGAAPPVAPRWTLSSSDTLHTAVTSTSRNAASTVNRRRQ